MEKEATPGKLCLNKSFKRLKCNWYVFALILLLFQSRTTYSQAHSDDTHKITPIEIGLNINLLTTDNKDVGGRPGFGISFRKIWMPERRISICSGLLFNQTRFFIDQIILSHYSYCKDITFSLYSFMIPLLVRVNFGHIYKFFAEAGPAFDIMPVLHGKGTEVSSFPLSFTQFENKISEGFDHDRLACTANFGIGLKIPIKKCQIMINGLYHYNLSTVLVNGTNTFTLCNYFSIGAGVFIY